MSEVQGHVEPGFEAVREVFAAGLADLGRGGGAFAVSVDGRPVVDLWAGLAAPGRPWTRDTRGVLMSATKGLVALCVQILVDRGRIDVDAPVADYWPEFAQGGKQAITVADVMTHASGVIGLPGHEQLLDWDGGGWGRWDEIVKRLELATPAWVPGERHGYHALTIGWIAGELVRRVAGVSVGAFFAREVAEPLGLDLRIGTPEEAQRGLARTEHFDSMELPAEVQALLDRLFGEARDPGTTAGQAFLAHAGEGALDRLAHLMNSPAALAAEIPAGNGTGSARSLARLYAALARGGELDGVRLVSRASVERFATERREGPDAVLGTPVRWGLGYQLNTEFPGLGRRFGDGDHAFGHGGAGGQIGMADPERGVSAGFVRNHLTLLPVFTTHLFAAVYRCL